MKNFGYIVTLIVLTCAGFWIGMKISMPPARLVETTRMEKCLNLYGEYRKDGDQQKLVESLQPLFLSPKDFQEIIDRFIFYRSRKSSMDQAMTLLKAFRLGYEIEAANVYSISGFASEPFRLDAEILAVFESRPDLIKQAFEG